MSESQDVFKKLKAQCVPIMGNSLLTQSNIPVVSSLLSNLISTLQGVQSSGHSLSASLISYIFLPLSTIVRRNLPAAIPDQILEKILIVISILCESWWWECDVIVWEQIFILCGAILGGIEGKGKAKERDDETKAAAAKCLHSLTRERGTEEGPTPRAAHRLAEFQAHATASHFVPVLGQTLDSLVTSSVSRHLPLQRLSLQVLRDLISIYIPDSILPSIMPGVISSMTKVALGVFESKGWANGDIVSGALEVMQQTIVRGIGDDVCLRAGAVRKLQDLEDLANIGVEPSSPPEVQEPYATIRTPVWLRATSSQLLIAMNTLAPLLSHPTPSALLALSQFSYAVLSTTSLTLPEAHALLLSFLLTLSISPYPAVSKEAREGLLKLLTSCDARQSLMQSLMQQTRENLMALPRMFTSQTDSKIEHVAGLVDAVCRLAIPADVTSACAASVGLSVGKLLGPTGGVEKWGWSLLPVLHLVNPTNFLTPTPATQLMLEKDADALDSVSFPDVTFKNVSSSSAKAAIVRMFRSLGRAGGEPCLFAVEWFATVGKQGKRADSVAALWCACVLMEGVGSLSLDALDAGDVVCRPRLRRLEKLARAIARNLAELWDGSDVDEHENFQSESSTAGHQVLAPVITKSTLSLHDLLNIRTSKPSSSTPGSQLVLHRSVCLRILSITAGILQSKFTPLLLQTLYPVLHSVISPDAYLSSTAMAALRYITTSTSYASPANLLLSNFDYALDAISRKLTRRWLDLDAAKVLAILVRLVGSDIVQRAGDVVEECFDRLDEFHGYDAVVESLVEVLGEVVKVVGLDGDGTMQDLDSSPAKDTSPTDSECFASLLEWVPQRHRSSGEAPDSTDHVPTPREAWGKGKEKADDEDAGDPKEQALTDAPQPTVAQALTGQIVSHSLYFLTHGSSVIRARILRLLSASVPVLLGSALLPLIHQAWPYILNRLRDPESFVVEAAAALVESLAIKFGTFMSRRIWDDVWPIFRILLNQLDAADSKSALARGGHGGVGTVSVHTHSHRLYRSLLCTMHAAAQGVEPQDSSMWQVALAFRRFLHKDAHEELQASARELYLAIGSKNEDATWLALSSTVYPVDDSLTFLFVPNWDVRANVEIIMERLAPTAGD